MSFEPPKSEQSTGVPGYLVVLVAFSVLVFLLAAAAGLIAFGVVDFGSDDDPAPTVSVDDQDLQVSGFTMYESRLTEAGRREVDVQVSVTNIGDEPLSNSLMMVQCLDGGNVSNSALILNIDPDQTLQYELTLIGTGEPSCSDPQIGFDTN